MAAKPSTTDETPKLRGFSTVRISKKKVLDKIKANRDEHRRIFEEALEGWKAQVTKDLAEAAAEAKAGKAYKIRLNLIQPIDHTDDYDSVIALLDLSLDTEFELTWQEFQNFVMDKWGWQTDFLTTSSAYGSGLARAKAETLNQPLD